MLVDSVDGVSSGSAMPPLPEMVSQEVILRDLPLPKHTQWSDAGSLLPCTDFDASEAADGGPGDCNRYGFRATMTEEERH